jgi:hypothetical protein
MEIRTSSFDASGSGLDDPARPQADRRLRAVLEHHYALPVVVEVHRQGSAHSSGAGRQGSAYGPPAVRPR